MHFVPGHARYHQIMSAAAALRDEEDVVDGASCDPWDPERTLQLVNILLSSHRASPHT